MRPGDVVLFDDNGHMQLGILIEYDHFERDWMVDVGMCHVCESRRSRDMVRIGRL